MENDQRTKHPVQEVGRQVCSIWTAGRKSGKPSPTTNQGSVLTIWCILGMFMLVIHGRAGQALENGMMSGIEGFATNSCFVSNDLTSEPYKGI